MGPGRHGRSCATDRAAAAVVWKVLLLLSHTLAAVLAVMCCTLCCGCVVVMTVAVAAVCASLRYLYGCSFCSVLNGRGARDVRLRQAFSSGFRFFALLLRAKHPPGPWRDGGIMGGMFLVFMPGGRLGELG